MGTRRVDKTFASVLAVGSTLALLPLGCGAAANEDYAVVQSPSSEGSSADGWTVSETIVDQMRSCVQVHGPELKTHAHETKFDLRVTDQGDVQQVELRSSTLHHDALESCLQDALATVSIPSSVLRLRSSEPMSGGESSRESRGPLGAVQAIGGAIVAAGPIILLAAGVTIAVYVAAVATEEAIEAAKRRTKREKWCFERLYACVGSGHECSACFLECKKDGVWDERKCPLFRPN